MDTRLAMRAACGVALTSVLAGAAAAEVRWYSSVEALLLTPKTNSQGFNNFFYAEAPVNVETKSSYANSMEGGVRFVGGFEDSCCGFGGRVRYFLFDNTVDYRSVWDSGTPVSLSGGVGVDVDAFDCEVTQRGEFRKWDLLVAGGLRYGGVDVRENSGLFSGLSAAVFFGPTGVSFDGVGPTFAGEARRELGASGLSIVGRARTALLFGDIDIASAFHGGGAISIEDEFVQVWEFQFGLAYDHDCSFGTATCGVFWEAQRWDSESNALGDLALHGLSLMGGITF
ncbi:MAG: Lpg1974 family pore-forming outer membrane protein [Planctomycetota bacterium]